MQDSLGDMRLPAWRTARLAVSGRGVVVGSRWLPAGVGEGKASGDRENRATNQAPCVNVNLGRMITVNGEPRSNAAGLLPRIECCWLACYTSMEIEEEEIVSDHTVHVRLSDFLRI